ncbi:MAG: hypothetical protein WCK09_08020 [Bacteroidota bacterium]
MLRKIAVFLLLIALMVNLMGYFVIFQFNQLLLRHEMASEISSGMPSLKLEKIKIPKATPDKTLKFSDDNEFYYNGILYDVVSKVSLKDTITYTCIRDANEQNLINRVSLFLHNSSALKNTRKAKSILVLIENLMNQALTQKTLLPKSFPQKDFLFPVMSCHITIVFFPDYSPPPEFC